MDDQYQVLICKVSDYYLAIEITSVVQIVQLKDSGVNLRKGTYMFRTKSIPLLNIFHLLNSDASSKSFVLILDSEKGLFALPVSEVKDIIQVKPDTNANLTSFMNRLSTDNYIKRVILYDKLPVVVADLKQLYNFVNKKKVKKKGKRRQK